MNEQQEIVEKLAVILTKMEGYDKDIKILYRKCEELSISTVASEKDTQKIFILVENMTKKIDEMNDTLKELSSKPSKNWDNIVKTIITGVVMGAIGFMISKLTGK